MPSQRPAYTSDLTDEKWQILEPLLPPGQPGGRRHKYLRRDVMDAIQYVLPAGGAWRLVPHDWPHWQTAYHYVRL